MYLLIDECCSNALVRIAAELGHTAQRSKDVRVLGPAAPDRWIFGFARSEGAVLVTANREDMRDLAAYGRGGRHPGVIVLPQVRGQAWRACFGASLPSPPAFWRARRTCSSKSMRMAASTSYRLP
jgi:predicted nuclease of predicted toxin-antitoxin system